MRGERERTIERIDFVVPYESANGESILGVAMRKIRRQCHVAVSHEGEVGSRGNRVRVNK